MYLATNPSNLAITLAIARWYAAMTSRKSSGSRRAPSAVEPTRSQNITVSGLRSASAGAVAALSGTGLRSLRNAAIAASNLRRCPTRLTPRSLRSSAVSSGNTAASIAWSRNAASYCCISRLWSQAAMSTLASPDAVTARAGLPYRRLRPAREESARLIAGQGDAVHDAAEAVVIVDRVVLGAAIVPEGERARLPAKAAGKFRALLMGEQIL